MSVETTLTGPGASCPTGFTESWIFCSFTAKESGTLTVRASVNGGPEQVASITVNALDCIVVDSAGVPDTLLNGNPLLRRGLRDAFDASNPTGPANTRLERGGQLSCAGGDCAPELAPVTPQTTPCRNAIGLDPTGALVRYHAHPFWPVGFGPLDTLPRMLCWPDEDDRPSQPVGARPQPSNADISNVWGTGIPHYVIDPARTYFIPDLGLPLPLDPEDPAETAPGISAYRAGSRVIDRQQCDPLAF